MKEIAAKVAASASVLLPILAIASIVACKKDPSKDPALDAATDAALASGDGGADGGAAASSGDDVEPVYPIEPNAPPLPLAKKLCEGLTEMPEKKRAACCSMPTGVVVTSECIRTLSAALRYKAVEIAEADVDKCIAAFDKTLDGCDWVGPFAPGPPAECQNIVKGLLGEGAKCRSSLECQGSLRCKGAGPTQAGKCGQAKLPGELCGGTVDTLATYVRQNDLDKQHPECATNHCVKHRCAMAAGEGVDCQVTQDCVEGLQCLPTGAPAAHKPRPKSSGTPPPEKKCVRRAMPKEGEPCPAGVCSGDLQCILNRCTSRKATGADCTADFECHGGCIKTGGSTKGKCGPRCDIR